MLHCSVCDVFGCMVIQIKNVVVFGVWFWCKLWVIQDVTCIFNVFGCHCRPLVLGAGACKSVHLLINVSIFVWIFLLMCKILKAFMSCSFYCRARKPITVSRVCEV